MILCVVLFPLKMHMLPQSNDPCIIFSLKNASLSSKYAIFIRDLCPDETRYPLLAKKMLGRTSRQFKLDRCLTEQRRDLWLCQCVAILWYCAVAEQPDAAMKMCLSVIRLFNLSGGTGLSVSLTLANLPDLGLVHLHVPRQPKIFPSQTKYFSICAISYWWVTQTCKLGAGAEVGTPKWVWYWKPTNLLTRKSLNWIPRRGLSC